MESTLWNGLAIGAVPTFSMLMFSLCTINFDPSATFESTTQNFCAGLILGAVARELFPEISDEGTTENIAGITLGTVAALILVNFVELFVVTVQERVEAAWAMCVTTESLDSASGEKQPIRTPSLSLTPEGMTHEGIELVDKDVEQSVEGGSDDEGSVASTVDGDHKHVLLLSSQAISSAKHRGQIRDHVAEMLELIESLQQKANQLTPSDQTDVSLQRRPRPPRSPSRLKPGGYQSLERHDTDLRDCERLADEIDSEVHRLQYTVDKCRRLLQGSGATFEGVIPRTRVTVEGKQHLQSTLSSMQRATLHLQYTLTQEAVSHADLHDLYEILDKLDHDVLNMHTEVEAYSFKWGKTRRSRKKTIVLTETGGVVPLALVSSVVVDCIVDGFLMGSTAAVSLRAGSILAFANSLEMGFLGMAVALKIQKCTASYPSTRLLSLIVPPFIMLGSAVGGMYAASLSQTHPVLFTAFISFGIVALVHLVLNELLSEARETIRGKEQWWTAMVVFAGIYVVVLLDLLLPN